MPGTSDLIAGNGKPLLHARCVARRQFAILQIKAKTAANIGGTQRARAIAALSGIRLVRSRAR